MRRSGSGAILLLCLLGSGEGLADEKCGGLFGCAEATLPADNFIALSYNSRQSWGIEGRAVLGIQAVSGLWQWSWLLQGALYGITHPTLDQVIADADRGEDATQGVLIRHYRQLEADGRPLGLEETRWLRQTFAQNHVGAGLSVTDHEHFRAVIAGGFEYPLTAERLPLFGELTLEAQFGRHFGLSMMAHVGGNGLHYRAEAALTMIGYGRFGMSALFPLVDRATGLGTGIRAIVRGKTAVMSVSIGWYPVRIEPNERDISQGAWKADQWGATLRVDPM